MPHFDNISGKEGSDGHSPYRIQHCFDNVNGHSPHGIQHCFDNVSGKENPNEHSHSRHDKKHPYNLGDTTKEINGRLGDTMSSQEQQPENLERLRKNLGKIVHKCNLHKIRVPNEELGHFTDPSANDVKEMVETGIKIDNKVEKGVFYMNPCFCLSLYFISKLKKEYPNLAERIKLNVEIFIFNGAPSAHAFVEIDDGNKVDDGNKKPIVIDYPRHNDACIYRGDYHNDSEGVNTLYTISIPADKIKDEDGIVSIAKNNEKSILAQCSKHPEYPQLTSDTIAWMLNARTTSWMEDNSPENYEAWHDKHGDSSIYCFENSEDKNGDHKRIKLKIESDNPLKIYLMENENEEGNCTWSELKNSPINFKNNEFNNFIASIVNK